MSYKKKFTWFQRLFKFDSIKQQIYTDIKQDTAVDISSSNRFNRGRSSNTNEFNTYDEYLIKENINDITIPWHREERIAYDPLINAYVMRRADEIFGPGFKFKDVEGKKELTGLNPRKVHNAFEEYEIDEAVKILFELWCAHGWAFIVQFVRNGEPFYRVYSQMELPNYERSQLENAGDILKDVYGFPIAIRVPIDEYDTQGVIVREPFFVFVNLGAKRRNVFPTTPLKAVWNQAINFVESLHSQKNFMVFFALIPFMRVPPNYSNEEQNKMQRLMKLARFGNQALVARGKKDDLEFEMKGGAAVMPDFPANLQSEIQSFAAPTGYPARWFLGDPKGALEAAGQDDVVVVKRHEATFARWRRVLKQIFIKFCGINPDFEYTLESNLKERETAKDKWEREKLEAEAIMTGEYQTFNEMREKAGLKKDNKYADKYYFEIIAEAQSQFNMQVQGLGGNDTPQGDEPQLPEPQKPKALPASKTKDSLIDKWEQIPRSEFMRVTNSGAATHKKVDSYLHDLHNDAHLETHDLSFAIKTDSVVEDDEFYIIDGSLFDGNVKLQYVRDSEMFIERNPPEEIEKWVIANKGKQIPFGAEHEDGIELDKNLIGYFTPLKYDAATARDLSKFYIRKDKVVNFKEFHDRLKANEPIELSGAYRSKDVQSVLDGITWDHTNLDVGSGVFTMKGRCGPTCATQPN